MENISEFKNDPTHSVFLRMYSRPSSKQHRNECFVDILAENISAL